MTLHEEPLVTVLTPVYNMGHFLTECIESVLSQTYKNFEYIIVNNCSTDQSLQSPSTMQGKIIVFAYRITSALLG